MGGQGGEWCEGGSCCHVFALAAHGYFAVCNVQDLVSLPDKGVVVGGSNHNPMGCALVERTSHGVCTGGVKVGCWFVKAQHIRIAQQGPCQSQTFDLPT
jgi:hypothetical protein